MRLHSCLASVCILATTLAVAAQAQSAVVDNRVFLIRHGEKPLSNGYNLGLILAQQPQSDGSQQRPYDTIKPLADSLGLTPDTQCQRDDTSCVADQINQFAQSSQSDILICWEHKALKSISAALGDKFKYPKSNFDLVYEIVNGDLTNKSPWSENCPGLDK